MAGVAPLNHYNGIQVFSATRRRDREELGERITAWLRAHPGLQIVDKRVQQSSDRAFHCLVVTLFYRDPEAGAGER